MGCRRYFAASRLEVLLDEDDSRSSSRALERGSFLLVSQLHVAIQTLWSQRLFPRAVWTNRLVVHSWVSPFLFDLRLRFRLRLRLYPHVQQTLAHNSGWMVVQPQVSPFLTIVFLIWVGFVGYLCCFQQLLNPILSSNYLERKSLEEVEVTHKLSRL